MRILMIDIDTLRPDHMGCYGYCRDTTPVMDAIARQGTRFTNYYCSDAPCLPSRASLLTGMFGILNGAAGHGGTAADKRLYGAERDFRDQDDENNLHNIFRKAGMHTASVSTFPERHSAWWFNAGLNEAYNVGGGGMESGEAVLPVALDWLGRNGARDDWFLHVHFWDPHTPYRAPASFGNPFVGKPIPGWITPEVFARHLKHTGPHSANEISMYDDSVDARFPRHPGRIEDMKGLRALFDGYDCGVRYADGLVGEIVKALAGLGVYEDTAVIITSDHGENMGELGIYAEHATACHSTCNIPMIIKWPGMGEGLVDDGLHYSLDLLPTLAELLRTPRYEGWTGASYVPALEGESGAGRDALVLSQMAHVCQRSARFDDWLYMRTYHDGYHLFDDEMLFNLKRDPHQITNLRDDYPDVCARGAKIILDWHDNMMRRSRTGVDPLWTVLREGGPYHARGHLERYLERLERTGRADGAARLRERHMAKR